MEKIKPEKKMCEKHGEYLAEGFPVGGRVIFRKCPKCVQELESEERKLANANKIPDFKMLVQKSGIPTLYQGKKLSSYEPSCSQAAKIKNEIAEYLDDFEFKMVGDDRCWFETLSGPKSLIFIGDNGTGKTHLSCALMQELLFYEKIKSAKYITAYKLSRTIKESWNKNSPQREAEIVREFVGLDFLVIDEVGVQYGSETDILLFFQIFNERHESQKPTLLISNKNATELKELFGTAVADRFKEGMVFPFTWESKRGIKDHG